MKKLLRRLIYLMLLGIITYMLTVACSLGNSDNPRSFVQPANNCRIVKHSMGETCVPQNPKRVVTIFHGILGNALSLGVKPIASTVLDMQNPFPAYLKNQVDGIQQLGSQNAPNLERILKLKPDLILVWENIQAIYPLLAKISPTAVVPWHGPAAWREHIEFVAKSLGKEEEVQQAWKHYYQRINGLKVALGTQYYDKEISIVAPTSQWGFFIQAKNSFAGSILNDLGLKRPKSQDVNTSDGYITFTSEEELEMIDGDIMFVMADKKDDRKAFEKIIQKPLGKKLKAVQQGHVYFVNDLAWLSANLIAADVVIDDIEKYLVNTP